MNKIGNFLWRLFSMTMVFFYHSGSNFALAEETLPDPADDPKITSYFSLRADVSSESTIVKTKICNAGYYLQTCGGEATLGTEWLKGMRKTVNGANNTSTIIKTPDYYSYNSSNDENMNNLRKFFRGQEPITYTKKISSNNNEVTYSSAMVTPAEYTQYRNQILSNFCTTDTGKISGYNSCVRCPNDAMVEASTVEEDTYGNGRILWDTWDVRTIADCYLKEFSDDTGTYVYMSDNIDSNAQSDSTKCYYSSNVSGKKPVF